MKRSKHPVASKIGTRAEAEAAAAEIARMELERRNWQNLMDNEVERARLMYSANINALAEDSEVKLSRLTAWADQNRGEFAERRSIETPSATFGFRLGTPKVGKLRGWTWERVLEAVKATGWPFDGWLRQKWELNKERILTDRKVGEKIERLGIVIEQDETFFVEPKLSEPARAMKQEAA